MKFRIKIIDDNIYSKKGDLFFLFRERKSSRNVTWITLNQINNEYLDFFDKIDDIFTKESPCFSEKSKQYALSIVSYLELFEFLSWKQFDSIWNICSTYTEFIECKEKGYYKFNSVISLRSKNVKLTLNNQYDDVFLLTGDKLSDRDLDNISIKLFGNRCMAEEDEEGLELGYDNEGNRTWYIPLGDCGINY